MGEVSAMLSLSADHSHVLDRGTDHLADCVAFLAEVGVDELPVEEPV